ncbi:vesicle transport v-snare protein vti1 [Rhodocollybia butyracea]|uniref:Vesicle transport v-snare protein vti1 n=1 Tax=Rhodocollybia butyracea TaxID=206335 RepID=A0A9P5Q919_9AGAR|nr:vesicle transport v-snare protein vti1 [Rhodocollybia butyracea]
MDTSPTALFDSYEQDFKQFIQIISEKLEADENQDGEQRKATLRRVEMELDEADEMVSQMDIEIQGIPQSLRPGYQTRLRTAKADLSRFKKMFKDVSAQLARASLLGSSSPRPYSSDDPYGSSTDRSRLLAGTAILEDGTKRLQDSHRLALETEEQGADILLNLRQQREQIENSRGTLEMANSSISRASNTLTGMIRRMYQQRFVTGAIIAILVLLIIIVVWSKLS